MAKLTDEKIKEIQDLYRELGVYAQVAKKTGVCAASVKKYVLLGMEEEELETIEKTEFDGEIRDIKNIPKPASKEEWQKILEWTPEEWAEADELRKEGVA